MLVAVLLVFIGVMIGDLLAIYIIYPSIARNERWKLYIPGYPILRLWDIWR